MPNLLELSHLHSLLFLSLSLSLTSVEMNFTSGSGRYFQIQYARYYKSEQRFGWTRDISFYT